MKPSYITDIDWKILKEKYPNHLNEIIKKLENNYPVQYLIGYVDFCDAKIEVNENVLIPRFETEYLVEKVINKLKNYPNNTLKILDIGTGSGCIVIGLAKKLNQTFEGIDISVPALEVAKKNAKLNNVNIKFIRKDILNEKIIDGYDVIVSNPPYVSFDELVDDKTKYEPQNAIFAKNDGLEFYKKIINSISNVPKLIAFEIGMNQGKSIEILAKKRFPEANVIIKKDLTGRDRYIFIEN